MDHDFIINTIIENNGIICGGYMREWVINNTPSDQGWSDIDIKCTKENEKIIENLIKDKYPNIELDFRINNFTKNESPFSFNLFLYDGKIKVVNEFEEYNNKWIEYAKQKKCVVMFKYLNNFKQKILKDKILNGWIFLNSKDEIITDKMKIFIGKDFYFL
ncbi:MAG: hypothetical protein EBR82_29555 [Caulobacteraceae bacterium]|nr:hypothetical protein [Caulobacteraceae bacterium]